MEEACYVGSYWGARQEAAAECAHRAKLFFRLLTRCDASLGQWYRAGKVPRGTPGLPLRTDRLEDLEEQFLRGRNRTDLNKRVIEELGFSLRVWNQRPDRRASKVSIHCGSYSERVGNSCLLDPPSEGETAERMTSLPTLIHVLTCMATAWDPDWGVVNSNRTLLELAPDAPKTDAAVGWVTYFARRRGPVPPLPAPVRIEPVGNLGLLVLLTPERFTASNPEHLALARRVREFLARAGLLRAPTA